MKLKKSLIAIAIATLPVSNIAMADGIGTSDVNGRIELRIPISDLRSEGAAPSVYSPWTEITSRQYTSAWTPPASAKVSEYSKDKGRVLRDSAKDVADPDFAQQREYTVTEERYEQRMVYDGDGDAVPDGDPIREERTISKIEHGLATVASGAWINMKAIECTEWNSVGDKSRYLTPYTENAVGQERECTVPQEQSNVLTDSDKVDYPYDGTRILYWVESSSQQGLLDNRSCKTLKDFYLANKAEIAKADSSWSYNNWQRLDLSPSKMITSYCDEGYTLVAAQYEDNPIAWTGGGYGNGDNLRDKLQSKKSFALTSSDIPAHTAFAVGQDLSIRTKLATTYSTGNLNKSASGFRIHRSTTSSYLWHNPYSNTSSASEWRNTLTVESSKSAYGSGYNWAFSPNALASCSRGYALKGYKPNQYDKFSWTVWVH